MIWAVLVLIGSGVVYQAVSLCTPAEMYYAKRMEHAQNELASIRGGNGIKQVSHHAAHLICLVWTIAAFWYVWSR